ncbi:DUF1868 domain-containing protein [Granulicella sp. WH15]|uniref:DUF1868 domain-containing protein n=1 Tax=Granulicella sp. WH15 TaxID=2602070 RepID=UPI0013A5A627|nr:DUF1868 domain-containing protein [Granulicella sp. WH15]
MSQHNNPSSRRDFLMQSSALAAASLLPTNLFASALQTAPSAPHIPNRDTQLKFTPEGTPRPFAGNTVICHLPVQCAMRDAMLELHDALVKAPFYHKLGPTSPDSYHMTIFPGANDQDRTVSGWPSYVPADAPIEVCNRMVGERIAKAHLACELPIRVRINQASTLSYSTACTLRMMPADDNENIKLRSIRDHISEIYGFKLKDHAAYVFHITMSYQIAPFTDQEQSAYREMLKTHVQRIIDAQPVLEFGNPEYCTFPDMFRFDPQLLLKCS